MGFLSEIGVLLKGFNELNAPLLEAEGALASFKDAAQSAMQAVNADFEIAPLDTTALDEASGQIDALGIASKRTAEELDFMIDKSEEVGSTLANMGDESSAATVKLDEMGKQSEEAAHGLEKIGKKARQSSMSLESLGKKAMLIGGILLASLGLAVDSASDFNSAMAEVSTLVDTSATDMNALTSQVRELSKEYGQMPVDTAKALYTTISAGFGDAADATVMLGGAMKLARGGITDTGTAIDGLTSIMNSYGMSADQVTGVSDQMFVAMKAGKTTIGELSASLGKVTPLASAAGVGLDQLLSATSALTLGGLGTAEAVTSLRGVLAAVMKPTGEATKVAQELGIEFSGAALKSMGLAGWLAHVKEKSSGNQEAMSKLFGSVEAFSGVLALTGNQAGSFASILEQMGNSAGATDEALAKVNATAGAAFDRAKANAAVFMETIGNALMPIVVTLANGFAEVLDKVSSFAEAHPTLTKFAGVLTAVSAGVLLAGGAALVMSGMITSAMAAVHISTGGLLLAFGAVVAGITGLVLLFSNGTDEMGESAGTFSKILAGVKDAFYAVTEPLAYGLGYMVGLFSAAWYAIAEYGAEVWPLIKGAVLNNFGPLIDFIGFGVELLTGYITTAWDVIAIVSEAVWDGIALTVSTVWTNIYESLALALNLITGLFKAGLQILNGDWDGAWQTVQETFSAAWDNIKNIFGAWMGWLDGLHEIFLYAGSGLIDAFWQGIQSAWGTLKEGFGDLLGGLRALLPGSDAEEGPLSQLTASGRALLPTFSKGIRQNAEEPALAVADSLNSITLEAPRIPPIEANHSERRSSHADRGEAENKRGFTVIFQKGAIQIESRSGDDNELLNNLEERLTEVFSRLSMRMGVQNA